jgi:hypothetical protein
MSSMASKGKLAAIAHWLWLRKNTTPAHWGLGALCAALSYLFFPAGFLLLAVFGVWEHWNDVSENTKQGFMDWWESFLVFCIGLAVLVILSFIGKINLWF